MILETDTIKDKLQRYQTETTAEFERILPFWMQHAIDHKNGGFIGRMDNEGKVEESSSKGGVLNARILWSFSAGYRFTKHEEYRTNAERAFQYLLDHFVDEEFGGTYWAVDAQGAPLSTRKQIYALAFSIYGLSEYFLATGDEKALQVAKDLFYWIERHSFDPEQGGYFEAFSREGGLLEDLRLSEKDRNDPKTMNTHLHILEAYAKRQLKY